MHHSPCVLVTGGAKRIGNKICRTLHANGFNLLIHYNHSKDDAESLMHELNESRANSAHTIHFDLANVESIKTLDVENINPFGRLDVLVNNASRFYPTPIGRIDINDWDDLFTSNVQGQFF